MNEVLGDELCSGTETTALSLVTMACVLCAKNHVLYFAAYLHQYLKWMR